MYGFNRLKRGMAVALIAVLACGCAFAAERTPDLDALCNAKAGDVVCFGAYEQDNDAENGPEAIAWRVLENDGSSLLLNSVCVLDCKRYHSSSDAVTWETCALRAWLNGDFYAQSFSEAEKEAILLNHLENPGSERYDMPGGNSTEDFVYILSTQELSAFFASGEDMAARTTAYACAQGAHEYSEERPEVCYWLRNPGMMDGCAAILEWDFINYSGKANAKSRDIAVRPVIRVDLNR